MLLTWTGATRSAQAVTPGGPVIYDGEARFGFDVRMGTVVPVQLLDGPGLHLAVGGRTRIVGPLWLHLEGGVDRVAVSSLSETVALTSGTAEVETTYARWSMPAFGGLGLHWRLGDEGQHTFGIMALGGGAWQYGRQDVSVRGDPGLRVRRDRWFEPLAQGRIQGGIGLDVGVLTLALGWRGTLAPVEDHVSRGVQADGILLEAGWSSRF
ncbi:MAG: hypothetical protein ACE366_04180 [Bradymonadia bacterium]